tara:strand:+ start:2001 stop:2270 length:270 start_codon:yes stop_codon:yes gene_type:complete
MDEKQDFGSITSREFNVGDIVQWTTWNEDSSNWFTNYGILIKIENVIKSNRMVSISTVKPLNEQFEQKELFTLSLKLVNPQGFNSEMSS